MRIQYLGKSFSWPHAEIAAWSNWEKRDKVSQCYIYKISNSTRSDWLCAPSFLNYFILLSRREVKKMTYQDIESASRMDKTISTLCELIKRRFELTNSESRDTYTTVHITHTASIGRIYTWTVTSYRVFFFKWHFWNAHNSVNFKDI